MKRLLTLVFVSLAVIGCAPRPEDAARTTFTKWADEINRAPYQINALVLSPDGKWIAIRMDSVGGLRSLLPVAADGRKVYKLATDSLSMSIAASWRR